MTAAIGPVLSAIGALLAATAGSDAVAFDTPFVPWFVERGVAVSIARETGSPWIHAVAEIEAAPERVFEAVTEYGAYAQTFSPYIVKSAVIERTERTARIHIVWRYPFPYRNRDAVVLYEATRLADGGFRVAWSDVTRPGDPSQGVRMGRVSGETRIEPAGEGRTRLTHTYLGNLGGRFPAFGEEKAWRREPLAYVLALRHRLGLSDPAASP